MITREKILVYREFEGKKERWKKLRHTCDHTDMTEEEWMRITFFIKDLLMIRKGLMSKCFVDITTAALREACDSDDTIRLLRRTHVVPGTPEAIEEWNG